MKLDLDCIRDVLIYLEDEDFNSYIDLDKLFNTLNYPDDQIEYTCLKLYEAGFINAQFANFMGNSSPRLADITDITYSGHQFLDDIRDNKNWKVIKESAKKVGSFSIKSIGQIATAYISSQINNLNF